MPWAVTARCAHLISCRRSRVRVGRPRPSEGHDSVEGTEVAEEVTTDRPSLTAWLFLSIVGQAAEKGLFGARYIRFGRFLAIGFFAFTTGVVLGRARRDRIEILARLLAVPEREKELSDFLRRAGTLLLEQYGGQPESLQEYFMSTQLARAGVTYPAGFYSVGLLQVAEHKLPLTEVEEELSAFLLRGIAFGASFPELAETLWREAYEKLDPESWAQARRAGLDIPEEQETYPLEQREQEVLFQVAAYAREFRPDLVDPLGLQIS
jgi:hypothetical protein